MSDDDERYAPGKLVTHESGTYSLIFSQFPSSVELDRFYEQHRTEGGGYMWTALVDHLMREHSPEQLAKVSFDPESSMFCAVSKDLAALAAVADVLKRLEDVEAVKALVPVVDLTAYD